MKIVFTPLFPSLMWLFASRMHQSYLLQLSLHLLSLDHSDDPPVLSCHFHSDLNLETSIHGCLNILNTFHWCSLSADCLPDVFLVLIRPTLKPDLQCYDAEGEDKVIYILRTYSFHRVTSLALF